MKKDHEAIKNLRNELREKLWAMGMDVDDMSERTLKTVKRIMETCEEKNRIHESSYVNYSTVAEAIGMSRKQVSENKDYKAVVNYYYTAPVRQHDERINELKNENAKYKAAMKDHAGRIDREFDLQAKVADLTIRLEDALREKGESDKALKVANEKNAELEKQISAIRVAKYRDGDRLAN